MSYRTGTNDFNTLFSCMTEDEYGLRDLELGTGSAVDIGAYAGGVAISLATDHPGARVIAVEPLTANVSLIRDNIARNGLDDRITVLPVAAGHPGQKEATIRWAFGDDESGIHHRFVGNSSLSEHSMQHEVETVDAIDLLGLVELAGGYIDLLKIDCEGAEYGILNSPSVKDCGRIVGEYHDGRDRLIALLAATHSVTTRGTDHFGEFTAMPL